MCNVTLWYSFKKKKNDSSNIKNCNIRKVIGENKIWCKIEREEI